MVFADHVETVKIVVHCCAMYLRYYHIVAVVNDLNLDFVNRLTNALVTTDRCLADVLDALGLWRVDMQ